MKFLIDNWTLVLMALTSGAMLLWPLLKGGASGGIDTAEAVRLVNREKGVLIDVSEPNEFAAGHAVGARNVPFGQVDADPAPAGLPKNKTLPVVVLCPTGARAGRAVALLKKAGYEKAVSIKGGTTAWQVANLPIEKTPASA
jgi:rhodanese-related sulfurtransferase